MVKCSGKLISVASTQKMWRRACPQDGLHRENHHHDEHQHNQGVVQDPGDNRESDGLHLGGAVVDLAGRYGRGVRVHALLVAVRQHGQDNNEEDADPLESQAYPGQEDHAQEISLTICGETSTC